MSNTSNVTFSLYLSTTVYEENGNNLKSWWETVGSMSIILLLLCALGHGVAAIRKKMKHKMKRKIHITWDTVSDFESIQSDFKSIQSIATYINNQHISIELFLSITVLLIKICHNTYTNYALCFHYSRKGQIFASDSDNFKSFYLSPGHASGYMAYLDFFVSSVAVMLTVSMYIFREYHISIKSTVNFIPNGSSLICFRYLDTNTWKTAIVYLWFSSKSISLKLIKISLFIPFMCFCITFGVWVFYIKIGQLSYIYNKDTSSLGLSELLVVFGVARQCATTVSNINKNECRWNYLWSTLHPNKQKELKKDPQWREKYNIDKLVCEEMILNHGLFGYLWLCHTFGDLNNVKKLYLQNYGAIHEDSQMAQCVIVND